MLGRMNANVATTTAMATPTPSACRHVNLLRRVGGSSFGCAVMAGSASSDLRRSPPLDARTADDRLEPRAKSHEGLVASVVVRRPKKERRLFAVHAAQLADEPLAVEPRADEGVRAPLVSDGGVLLVTGEDLRLVVEAEQDVEDRMLQLGEVAVRSRSPADGPPEEDV